MKKFIAIFLAASMLLSLAACKNSGSTEITADGHTETTAPINTEQPSTEAVTPTETEQIPTETTAPIVYEPNLPDDITLSIKGKETSILDKERARDILIAIDEIYAEQTIYAESDYPSIPYTLFYRGDTTEGCTFVFLDEWLNRDRNDVFLRSISVDFSAFNCPEISLMGINNQSTADDVFSVFGNSHEQTAGYSSSRTSHYWYAFKTDNYEIETICVDMYKNGTIAKLSIYFEDHSNSSLIASHAYNMAQTLREEG